MLNNLNTLATHTLREGTPKKHSKSSDGPFDHGVIKLSEDLMLAVSSMRCPDTPLPAECV